MSSYEVFFVDSIYYFHSSWSYMFIRSPKSCCWSTDFLG